MALTREQILTRRKLPSVSVPTPELGDGTELTVRRLSAREFMDLSAQVKVQPDAAYALWLVATVVDEQGAALFTADDVAALAEQDTTLIQRLTEAAMNLNVNPKEKAAKNSEAPSDDSSLASR